MEVNENEVNRVWLKSNSVIGQPLVNLNDRKDDAVVRSPSIPREKENEAEIGRVWMEEEKMRSSIRNMTLLKEEITECKRL